jgi:hypothetical protein
VPLLAVPLHAVFIFLIGQMFSDWFVCLACIFLLVGMSSVTIFGKGITPPDTDAQTIVAEFKQAQRKGLAFNVLAVVCLVLAVATNGLVSQTFPEISLRGDLTLAKVWGFVHWIVIFVAKFFVSKLQVTIIGADAIIGLIFTLVIDLDDKVIQAPYQSEARTAMAGMRRVWKEGDPAPTGFVFDLFGGAGDFNFLAAAKRFDLKAEAQRFVKAADAVAFTGVRCQLGGRGDMADVGLRLDAAQHPMRLHIQFADEVDGVAKTVTVSVADCTLAAPKVPRRGYPHCFRLDARDADEAGLRVELPDKKFVFALPDEASLDGWLKKLAPFESQASKRGRPSHSAHSAVDCHAIRTRIKCSQSCLHRCNSVSRMTVPPMAAGLRRGARIRGQEGGREERAHAGQPRRRIRRHQLGAAPGPHAVRDADAGGAAAPRHAQGSGRRAASHRRPSASRQIR